MARKNSNLITSVSATVADGSITAAKFAESLGGDVQRVELTAGQTKIANLDTISTNDDYTSVFKNGILLEITEDYTLDSDNGITLTAAADANDEITIKTIAAQILADAVISNGSVTTVKLADGAVTSDKVDATVASTGKAIAMAIVFG